MNKTAYALPELPLGEWEESKMTLHLYFRIVGKVRMALMPRKNHWWFITLYASSKGFTTGTIPYNGEAFEVIFNVIDHQLGINTSWAGSEAFPLKVELSVAEFYHAFFRSLDNLGIKATIQDRPYDLPVKKPFSEINEYRSYQKEYVTRFWKIMLWVTDVFKEFSGRFYGKTCPVHIYWHHMDLAVTRFSGKRAPAMLAEARISDKAAYSHENISFGFWAGDEEVRSPAFYSYTYPSPDGLDKQPLQPGQASWQDSNGSPMALLMYDDLRAEADPRQALLDFLESAYQAGANLAGWDVSALTVPPLSDL
ncbi:DUF5996 family protein [Roseivirga sp. BDSF3-8]|uniref:DUF5996 family protein n=1 Tax=Roseivirga sp. BDSF3-8 TaxID=3241598 RepID=UPI003531AAD1